MDCVLIIPDIRHFQSFGLGAMIARPRYKLLLLVGAWHFQDPGLGAMLVKPRYGPLLTACSSFRSLLSAYCCLPLVRSSPSRHPSLLWYTIGCVTRQIRQTRQEAACGVHARKRVHNQHPPFPQSWGSADREGSDEEKEAMFLVSRCGLSRWILVPISVM